MPAGKDGLLRKDTRDAAAVLAGRIIAYGVGRYGGPERSLRRRKERRDGTQLTAWEGAAGRNAAYGEGRCGGPERSLRREKERQTGTQLNDWGCLMGRAVLWFGG